jgi:FdhD protein
VNVFDGIRTMGGWLLRHGRWEVTQADVAVEEPLEIRLDGQPVAVTMRTPGHDVELAAGFLFTEGVIDGAHAIAHASHCDESPNVVDVRIRPEATGVCRPPPRHFVANTSCGLCGKTAIADVRRRLPSVAGDDTRIPAPTLIRLARELRSYQPLFRTTGSIHAAALFRTDGEPVCIREDVGRHNAVDKVIGHAVLDEALPLRGHVLLVSGRTSFEIAQKSIAAGIPILAGVSGPSTLAVDLACELGQTLVGFLRGDELNVYSTQRRIAVEREGRIE